MKTLAAVQTQPTKRVKFIEAKTPDMRLVGELLDECAAVNHWANFGPLYHRLADEYAAHISLGPGLTLTPCANAGVGLEMMARALAVADSKPKLRWVGSAFSFKNLGRGYFTDMQFLDCDRTGMLDFAALQALNLNLYDGIIVTNPFGMVRDFDRYIAFAQKTGKKLLIDNAAGLDRVVPAWPWQVFSLHHTKPYGVGEGGLVMSPEGAQEFLIQLINYDEIPHRAEFWQNNGKISDIACAFHIARLRQIEEWEAGYLEQRERIVGLFAQMGIFPLLPTNKIAPTNATPMIMDHPLDEMRLNLRGGSVDVARQYTPLAPLPRVNALYARLINFPTHPNMSSLSDTVITDEIGALKNICQLG